MAGWRRGRASAYTVLSALVGWLAPDHNITAYAAMTLSRSIIWRRIPPGHRRRQRNKLTVRPLSCGRLQYFNLIYRRAESSRTAEPASTGRASAQRSGPPRRIQSLIFLSPTPPILDAARIRFHPRRTPISKANRVPRCLSVPSPPTLSTDMDQSAARQFAKALPKVEVRNGAQSPAATCLAAQRNRPSVPAPSG